MLFGLSSALLLAIFSLAISSEMNCTKMNPVSSLYFQERRKALLRSTTPTSDIPNPTDVIITRGRPIIYKQKTNYRSGRFELSDVRNIRKQSPQSYRVEIFKFPYKTTRRPAMYQVIREILHRTSYQ